MAFSDALPRAFPVPLGVDLAPGPVVRAVVLNWPGMSRTKKKLLLARLRTQVGQPYLSAAIMEDDKLIRAAGGIVHGMTRSDVPGGCAVAFNVESSGPK